ncbi:hypothetical protein OUZ56_004921 [Daphnia magna]|uniref:Uncharacterized protein n=1 Tax=Daphnia magna TaxID=35525 RepID=A0ABQ9YR89_9CRUS|nr:hypothetical protein OUZ56_004921 [Daphnia magna]
MRLAEQSTGHQLGKREYQRTAVDDDAKRIMMMTGHQKINVVANAAAFIERVRLSAMIDEPNESRFTMTD